LTRTRRPGRKTREHSSQRAARGEKTRTVPTSWGGGVKSILRAVPHQEGEERQNGKKGSSDTPKKSAADLLVKVGDSQGEGGVRWKETATKSWALQGGECISRKSNGVSIRGRSLPGEKPKPRGFAKKKRKRPMTPGKEKYQNLHTKSRYLGKNVRKESQV